MSAVLFAAHHAVSLFIWPYGRSMGKKRIAICALVLKVRIIQPLRFNGYSSWLTNNLLCLHYFVYVFPYEKQRIEKKDQRFQKQLCFESQNALLPSNNREGFYAQASVSHFTLAHCSRQQLHKNYFNSSCLPHTLSFPIDMKLEVQPSCQPAWKAFCKVEIAAVPEGRGTHRL